MASFRANFCIGKFDVNGVHIFYHSTLKRIIPSDYTFNVSVFHSFLKYFRISLIKFIALSLPYDWRSPIPYIGTCIVQAASVYFYIAAFSALLFVFVGFCLLTITFVSDIKECLRSLNDAIKAKNGTFTIKERIELKDTLRDIIQFHCDAIKLSNFLVII